MLNIADLDLLHGMVQGRINAVKANKGLDAAERDRLVAEYEGVMHRIVGEKRRAARS